MGVAIFTGSLGIICFTIALLSFFCKGKIITNPWLWLSQEERELKLAKVGKKAVYRQQAITFLLCGLLMVFIMWESFGPPEHFNWIAFWGLIAVSVVYAIWSSVQMSKKF
ncbi:MAG: DUF3784 domain-containing protein [Defluviitaleaceae bacterium]|nr:DUF3784 domain-containing protein [Defluviitaleaceae bacterium]